MLFSSNIFRSNLEHINNAWKDWEGKILILHKGSEPFQAFGRSFAYKNIFISQYDGEFGKFINIKIEKIDGFNLFGKVI
ncbi:MAG: hypothetical protein ACXAC5_18635 [Promethearchaeota archaeon]|jgi:tRNA A37 methylthiotransferase MiaB